MSQWQWLMLKERPMSFLYFLKINVVFKPTIKFVIIILNFNLMITLKTTLILKLHKKDIYFLLTLFNGNVRRIREVNRWVGGIFCPTGIDQRFQTFQKEYWWWGYYLTNSQYCILLELCLFHGKTKTGYSYLTPLCLQLVYLIWNIFGKNIE